MKPILKVAEPDARRTFILKTYGAGYSWGELSVGEAYGKADQYLEFDHVSLSDINPFGIKFLRGAQDPRHYLPVNSPAQFFRFLKRRP